VFNVRDTNRAPQHAAAILSAFKQVGVDSTPKELSAAPALPNGVLQISVEVKPIE
jgi:hypothetical protein